MLAVLSGFILHHITADFPADAPLTITGMRIGFYWLLATGLAIFFTGRIGKYLARNVYQSLGSYGSMEVFEFTRGDTNVAAETKRKNSKCITRFAVSTLASIGLAVVKGLACWFLVPK